MDINSLDIHPSEEWIIKCGTFTQWTITQLLRKKEVMNSKDSGWSSPNHPEWGNIDIEKQSQLWMLALNL